MSEVNPSIMTSQHSQIAQTKFSAELYPVGAPRHVRQQMDIAVVAKHLETGNGLSYMILQSKPASTRVCRGCHRGVHSSHYVLGWPFILWYELFTVTVPQYPNRLRRDMKL